MTVKAFPSAQGYGSDSVGGRGGRVIPVTNLNDSGSGSLRNACSVETGPRTVVFRVSGTITLTSGPINIRGESKSYITIAGQTSPGGVQLKGFGVQIDGGAHDVIIRYLRIRPGGNVLNTSGMIIYGDSPFNTYNVIIDHCSFQWCNDDTANTWGWVTLTTWQWNIISRASLPDGEGMNSGSGTDNGDLLKMSVHHNLLAHMGRRNPFFARCAIIDFRNNVVYNWGSSNSPLYEGNHGAVWGEDAFDHSGLGNFVKNHYIAGANTQPQWPGLLKNGGSSKERGGTKIYVRDNWGPNCLAGCVNDWDWGWAVLVPNGSGGLDFAAAPESTYRTSTEYSVPVITEHTTASLKAAVLAKVGARVPSRDSLDTTVINDVTNITGNITGNTQFGGPWPDLATGAPAAPIDTDGDGIPDSWETSHGLNPNLASDGATTASNGYTNLENYLNELAGDIVFEQFVGGVTAGGTAKTYLTRAVKGTGGATTSGVGTTSPLTTLNVALDATSSYVGAGIVFTVHTWNHTCSGANRLLLVNVSEYGSPTIPNVVSITFNGDALALYTGGKVTAPSDPLQQELWFLANPDSGTFPIIVTMSINEGILGSAISFTGAHQSVPLGTVASTSADTGTTASVAVTSATNEIVVDFVTTTNVGVLVPGAGQTERIDITSAEHALGAGISTEPGATSVTMNWGFTNNTEHALLGVGVKPAPVPNNVSGSGGLTAGGVASNARGYYFKSAG